VSGMPGQLTLNDGRRCVLRPARETDLPQIMACTHSVAQERIYIASDGETDPERFRRRFWEPVKSGNHICIVAEIDGDVVGYIDLQPGILPKRRHTAYIGELLLSRTRGMGIGTALMAAAVELARGKNIKKIFLSAFSINRQAIEFYKKNGFVVEAVLKGQFVIDGELVDEVYMARWIG
jgi:RimJ/RimL family protein N-acetyltransferase